jgi:two-component system, NtrC family, sensor kinase
MTAPPDDTTTDLHAVIATLRAERDAAVAREATRDSDYAERAAHQEATAEVLQAMTASAGDPKPVFEVIVRRARDLCDAYTASLAQVVDGLIVLRAYAIADEAEAKGHEGSFPRPVAADTMFGRAILAREPVQIPNVAADQNYALREGTLRGLVRSQAAVPLMRGGEAIGAINITRRQTGEFSPAQIELLQVFAEQAVIAIVTAETYRALQDRTVDLQESLEYQTATSDVLKVISRSTFDLQPVLDAVAETAARLCDAEMSLINRRDGDLIWAAANYGYPPEIWEYWKAVEPFPPDSNSVTVGMRTLLEGRVVHIHDVTAVPGYPPQHITLGKQRTTLGVPLLRAGEVIGNIGLARQRVEPFTDRQIALLEGFAAQAVIAIENTRLLTEQQEALEQQTATAEVLQVINASPGNLTPVFDAVLEKAIRLCDSAFGMLAKYDGHIMRYVAMLGLTREQEALLANRPLAAGQPTGRIGNGENVIHLLDARDQDGYHAGFGPTRNLVDQVGARTAMWVALRKDKELLGILTIFRREVRAFTAREIALVQNFAAQAVIAMENARLINEQREALEQQTATAEVLQVINASPGNLAPVFDAILEKSHSLCKVAVGSLSVYVDGHVHTAATRGFSEQYQALLRRPYPAIGSHQALMRGGPSRQTPDFRTVPVSPEMASSLDHLERMNLRTGLWVPLRKDGTALGCISLYRDEVQPFSEKEIALLENFAAQAVIAMENARLLNEVRQRQEELRVTFENMGDGVAMFDEKSSLVAWNRKFQDILDLPDGVLAERLAFPDYIRYLTERGEYGEGAHPEEQIRRLTGQAGEVRAYERTRPDGRVIEIRRNPVPSGGFVLIFSDISERKRNEIEVRAARDAAEAASRTIEAAYRDLKAAQANLIQAEKMASLGQLTAGIAHEIKNPLNFVNNFAELSVDLLGELKDAIAPAEAALTPDQRGEVDGVVATLTGNLEKITEHGKRADGIVKAMLEHSRGSSAERRVVDLNALIDEALNLAYHGARAQDQSFTIALERDFGDGITPIDVNPQDITRVFLNIFSNGFYAATRRAPKGEDAGFVPTLKVTTRDTGEWVEIRVRDNGTGISVEIMDKLFQPFFTTKPTGEGTGLGLSITYDIVTKQHGGTIAVESEVGQFSEFTIRLPRQ